MHCKCSQLISLFHSGNDQGQEVGSWLELRMLMFQVRGAESPRGEETGDTTVLSLLE